MLPAYDYRRTHITPPEKIHQGLDGMLHNFAGRYRGGSAFFRKLKKSAQKITDQAEQLRNFSDRRLRDRLDELKNRFRRQAPGTEMYLDEALAILVEVAERTLGLRPYTVQIMGAKSLYMGYLVEMATGEGKSLTACLPAAIAAWTGRPLHIVTVNDYLAERDAAEMRTFYSFCGVSVGCVKGQATPEERRENYERGVVYTTSKELLADFLRDRLQLGILHQPSRRLIRQIMQPRLRDPKGVVMRGLDTVIVDEADSVLIDEAVTPLIISRLTENKPLADACVHAYRIADSLQPDLDYRTNLKYREIRLTDRGKDKIEAMSGMLPGIWRGAARRQELVQQAINANEFYHLEKQYVVQDGKLMIVDEFTGRLMPNRTWSHGLHQAIETKEGIEGTNPHRNPGPAQFSAIFQIVQKTQRNDRYCAGSVLGVLADIRVAGYSDSHKPSLHPKATERQGLF